MPRIARVTPGGVVFHVLNRRVEKRTLFRGHADYRAFENVLVETVALVGIRICAYCLMPNHWHLVLWPSSDEEVPRFMHRLTLTHAVRWKLHRNASGQGHLYQNRYKSFPVQTDAHYLTVVRYVERNALRANLVDRAEDWPYSSLWRRRHHAADQDLLLSRGPVELPADWAERVNRPESPGELEALRERVRFGRPYGTVSWEKAVARRLELPPSSRPRGRPKKGSSKPHQKL